MKNVLLNPGPASISMRVKMAQVVEDICPREREFGDLMQKISEGLLEFVDGAEDCASVLFCGSGTLAVEATLSSVVGVGQRLGVIVNGAYGERMVEMARYHGLEVAVFGADFLSPLPLGELESFVASENLDFLALVHSETTSGILNDLEAIGRICKPRGVGLIVDCMSSFACYRPSLEVVDFLIASSNKNIQGVAGMSFVIAKKENILKASHARSLYLDLKAQYEYFAKEHQMRFTPPVQVAYALYEAIEELREEGLENRFSRYQESNTILREGLIKLGFDIYPKQGYSVIITSVVLPDSLDFERMHDYCLARGFTIYPGKVAGKSMFRLANIGAIDKWDIYAFLEVLEEYLRRG